MKRTVTDLYGVTWEEPFMENLWPSDILVEECETREERIAFCVEFGQLQDATL